MINRIYRTMPRIYFYLQQSFCLVNKYFTSLIKYDTIFRPKTIDL